MFKKISFQNFKSWKDTGEIELAPITGFFGANSSGKSSILQFLLMLKQTMESTDRQRVLHTGDDRSYVNLGTTYDMSYQHTIPNTIKFSLEWDPLTIKVPSDLGNRHSWGGSLKFYSEIRLEKDEISMTNFKYTLLADGEKTEYEISQTPGESILDTSYRLEIKANEEFPKGYSFRSLIDFKEPIKNYGFPHEAYWKIEREYEIPLSNLVLEYEKAFQETYYLGPLRDYPKRTYLWSGERPQDVGSRGELAIPALLSSRKSLDVQYQVTVEENVAIWLKKLGLIDDFSVQPIREGRQEYEVKVRRTHDASEVLITDVGFGVSQILPVLVLCYYVPEGSTIIFEQPEIHLHPSVQSGLADVFIDVIKTRNIQIILESHSEHLLHRLQRRIAEEKDGLTNQDVKLYFCNSAPDGSSKLTSLQIDPFGNIANWPENFFGDEMGDLFAMTEAAMKRQMVND